ncbi:MAG: hypothetical protein KC496_17810 [Anaerolineae bacterium]|nr:hypothetical protein [Anaerolineae bacterium]
MACRTVVLDGIACNQAWVLMAAVAQQHCPVPCLFQLALVALFSILLISLATTFLAVGAHATRGADVLHSHATIRADTGVLAAVVQLRHPALDPAVTVYAIRALCPGAVGPTLVDPSSWADAIEAALVVSFRGDFVEGTGFQAAPGDAVAWGIQVLTRLAFHDPVTPDQGTQRAIMHIIQVDMRGSLLFRIPQAL